MMAKQHSLATKAQVLFVSHGGGPLPLLGDAAHQEMVVCLKAIAAQLKQPKAILVISAHWEQTTATITATDNPSLLYDYSGFPDEAYHIEYPCPGNPALAQQIAAALTQRNIANTLNTQRGLDHGVFVPLKVMYPNAQIPCVQLSLLNSLNPEQHLNIGKALQGLDLRDVLVIGSGFSFHNMRAFFGASSNDAAKNQAFEDWLLATCSSTIMTEAERTASFTNWAQAPNARYCHPREEHLLPLHVCYGLAAAPCSQSYTLSVLDKKVSMYLWQ